MRELGTTREWSSTTSGDLSAKVKGTMKEPPLPKGATLFLVNVTPDPAVITQPGGFPAWQKRLIKEMEAEGIVITENEGGCFQGYYFPDKIQPRFWLSK